MELFYVFIITKTMFKKYGGDKLNSYEYIKLNPSCVEDLYSSVLLILILCRTSKAVTPLLYSSHSLNLHCDFWQ